MSSDDNIWQHQLCDGVCGTTAKLYYQEKRKKVQEPPPALPP